MAQLSVFKKISILIVIIDVVWSAAAIIHDLDMFGTIPVYFWPFVVICPLYPLLLSLVWAKSISSSPNNYLLAFAALPSTIYLFAALIYYPTWMMQNEFDWLTFGAIFWVLAYGVQGFYLLWRFRLKLLPAILACVFLFASFIIQFLNKTFGTQDFTNFSDQLIITEYLTLFLITISTTVFFYKNNDLSS